MYSDKLRAISLSPTIHLLMTVTHIVKQNGPNDVVQIEQTFLHLLLPLHDRLSFRKPPRVLSGPVSVRPPNKNGAAETGTPYLGWLDRSGQGEVAVVACCSFWIERI